MESNNPYECIKQLKNDLRALEGDIDELTGIAQKQMTIIEQVNSKVNSLKQAFILGILFTGIISLAIYFK